MKDKKRFRLNLFGFIETLAFTAMLLIFIDGGSGWLMIYIIAGAMAVSLALSGSSLRRITAECSGFCGVCRKGDTVSAEIVFRGSGLCFMPFVTVSGSFMGSPFAARCSVIGGRGTVRITAKAQECCLQRLAIEEVTFRDMLRLVTWYPDINIGECTAAVLPDITQYSGPEVSPSVFPSDGGEETEGGSLAGGYPGYEHREYQPGDPNNRINYKLSAKKRILMVRRDENTTAESTDIVIAPGSDGSCAEQALALANRLISLGGTARVICGKDSFTAASPAAADRLREWLAFRDLGSADLAEPRRSESLSHSIVTISQQGVTVNGV